MLNRSIDTAEMDMHGIRCQICSWEVCGGGFVFFERGVRKKGGSDEPPERPLVTGLSIINKTFRHLITSA